MSVKTILIADINVTGLIRLPRKARIAAIARSIEADGLREPIEVSPTAQGARFDLVSGWVRLEAFKLLGRDKIAAEVRRASSDERRRREIESNLLSDGNTALDRARYFAAAKALYEIDHPETRHGGARSGDQLANDLSRQVGDLLRFSAYAAERYGVAERSIQRACAIGEGLNAKAAERLAPTPWADHQQGLAALSRFSAASQMAVVKLLTRDPNPVLSFSLAISMVEGSPPADPAKRAWSAAYGGYSRMSERDRRSYLSELVRDKLVPRGVQILIGKDEVA